MLNSADAIKAKLAWALAEGVVTRAALQRAAGLKTASGVSEWLRTGRVDKRHLPTIAGLTGTSVRWWLTPEAPIPPAGEWLTDTPTARAPRGPAYTPVVEFPSNVGWPFKFDRARFDRLSPRDQCRVEGAALNVLIECERGAADHTKRRKGPC